MNNQSSSRTKRARALVNAQRMMQRVEEARLMQLKRRTRELDDNEQRLMRLINSDETLQDILTFMGLRSLAGLQKEKHRLSELSQSQTERLIEQTVRSKLAERIFEAAGAEARREQEKQLLEEIIERYLHVGRASLP
jgi:hypothetical protein